MVHLGNLHRNEKRSGQIGALGVRPSLVATTTTSCVTPLHHCATTTEGKLQALQQSQTVALLLLTRQTIKSADSLANPYAKRSIERLDRSPNQTIRRTAINMVLLDAHPCNGLHCLNGSAIYPHDGAGRR
ncbi:MAG: hypothetical protein H6954_07225 [Chromatiaceae bacterium]|nr:hypothetical protein [Chromatiaceae bacterium]